MCVPARFKHPHRSHAQEPLPDPSLSPSRAEDGNEFSAFSGCWRGERLGRRCWCSQTSGACSPSTRSSALRFAQHGNDAVAIDYFGRTAGLAEREAEWDCWPHVNQTTQAGILADAAVRAGRSSGRMTRHRKVVTVGFCFGGSNSWHLSASGLGLNGAVGFYGHPNRPGFPDWSAGRGGSSWVDRVPGSWILSAGQMRASRNPRSTGSGSRCPPVGIDHQLKTYAECASLLL